MNTNLLTIAAKLSDDALLARMKLLADRSREVTVELIAHLVEVARRGLHRGQGPGKLFRYLTEVLHFSEAAAWNRIQAARAVRRFPVVLDVLADGSVNLTTVRLLAPHLTAANHRAILEEAAGKTKREVKKIVARLSPQPDVPAFIRKLPAPRPSVQPTPSVTAAPPARQEPEPLTSTTVAAATTGRPTTVAVPPPETHRPVVEPLSPERYRLQLTMGEEMHDDLRYLQDMMRREIPDGDPVAIVGRALKLLRQQVDNKAFAATSRPRPSRGTTPGSRDIPADLQWKVWERDGGRCAFVAKNGRRCTERSYLEFHHGNVPYAHGGEATPENISLRCRAHNEYESELIFGPYKPSRVREVSPTYGRAIPPVIGSGTSNGPTPHDPPPWFLGTACPSGAG